MTATVEASELQVVLGPVRKALLNDASIAAERLKAKATAAAAETVKEATAQANIEIERAHQKGEASSRARSEQLMARTRRDAHGTILATKRDIYLELQLAARTAVVDQLPSDPRFPLLMAALEEMARTQLGPETQIENEPNTIPGFVATDGQRRVDYTLVALADRAVDSLADNIAELLA